MSLTALDFIMFSLVRFQSIALVALTLTLFSSCARGPAPVKQPGIDPDDAGSQAMEMYDENGDGQVAGDELEKAPGLKAALPRMDTNTDKAVTAD
jgi:hypothetical protein